jgi:hypothetical protein
MGWTGYKVKTAEGALAAHLADAKIKAGPVWRASRGGRDRAWILAEIQHGEHEGRLIIVNVVLEYTNGYWYVKDVDETMGPVDYDCPEPWLMLSPPWPGSFSPKWREKVRLYWQERGGWASTRSEVESARASRMVLDADEARQNIIDAGGL